MVTSKNSDTHFKLSILKLSHFPEDIRNIFLLGVSHLRCDLLLRFSLHYLLASYNKELPQGNFISKYFALAVCLTNWCQNWSWQEVFSPSHSESRADTVSIWPMHLHPPAPPPCSEVSLCFSITVLKFLIFKRQVLHACFFHGPCQLYNFVS